MQTNEAGVKFLSELPQMGIVLVFVLYVLPMYIVVYGHRD
jgi:hypothetical protein